MEELETSSRLEFLISTDLTIDNTDDEIKDAYEETINNDKKYKLNIVLPQPRSRSPVTVQEWVASLPDHAEDEDDEDSSENEDDEEARDTFTLGAEGKKSMYYHSITVT